MRGCCLLTLYLSIVSVTIDMAKRGQGQMSIATLTIDKYRNNLVGIIETKPIYLDQTCDTWLPLTRKLCLLHKRSRSQLTYVGLNRNAFLCIAPVIHVYCISIKKEINCVHTVSTRVQSMLHFQHSTVLSQRNTHKLPNLQIMETNNPLHWYAVLIELLYTNGQYLCTI